MSKAIYAAIQRTPTNRDLWISHTRLSDKTSRLHPRHVAAERGQAYEPEVPVKVREWIGPALASPDLMLEAQPCGSPTSGSLSGVRALLEKPGYILSKARGNPLGLPRRQIAIVRNLAAHRAGHA
jgi:hypothetical protein